MRSEIPELNTSVFLIPDYVWETNNNSGKSTARGMVKNREARLVVLNDIARSIINSKQGIHPEFFYLLPCIFEKKQTQKERQRYLCKSTD